MYNVILLATIWVVLVGMIFFLIQGIWPSGRIEERVTGALASDKERLRASSSGYRIFSSLTGYLTHFLPEARFAGYFSRIEMKLLSAGSPGAFTPKEFFVLKGIGAFTLGTTSIIFFGHTNWILIIALAVFGFLYPDIWLRDRIRKRHRKILKEIPFSLDLLTLSVEAGLDISSGLERVVAKSNPGPLRDEFFLTLQEMKMGRSRMESLKRFASRIEIPDVTALIHSLIQAEEMGAGLGPALRVQSEQLRNKRFQRAEKLAMEAPVKMTFPLLFIFVSVFLMLFGTVLLSALRGGIL